MNRTNIVNFVVKMEPILFENNNNLHHNILTSKYQF